MLSVSCLLPCVPVAIVGKCQLDRSQPSLGGNTDNTHNYTDIHTTITLHRNTHNYNTTLNLTFLQLYSELNSNSQYCTVLHNALQICRTLQNLQNTRKCSKNVDIAVHLTTTLQVTLLEKHYRALYKTAKLCLTLQNTVRHYTTL